MPIRSESTVALGAYALAAAILVAFACSDATGPDGRSVALSFVSTSSAAANGALVLEHGGHTLVLEGAELTVSDIELAGNEGDSDTEGDTDTDTETDSEHDSDRRFGGSETVDLALDGDVVTASVSPVQPGVYDELEMYVERVRVGGTYDGSRFEVSLPVEREVELQIDPPFVVEEGSNTLNVTVALDVASWFRLPDGTLLDPRSLAGNPAALEALRARVLASFAAFEDGDRDGEDSH